jgi:DNA-directed RNA polymerase subunit beta
MVFLNLDRITIINPYLGYSITTEEKAPLYKTHYMAAIGTLPVELKPRVNFGKIRLPDENPDLLDIQLQGFQEFFQLETTPENRIGEGLFRVFMENFPITDARNIFVLEFLDYFIDPPRYSVPECMQRGLTYSVPLKAKLRLSCNDEEHVDMTKNT